MGVDVYIEVPIYTPHRKIMQVMTKLMGHEATPTTSQDDRIKRIDFSKPATSINNWHIRFDRSLAQMQTPESLGDFNFADFIFYDLAQQDHHWFFNHEPQYGNPFKRFLPGSTALNIALGKRLVEVFGGKVTYQDHTVDEFYEVSVENALYQPFAEKGSTTQEQNEHWYGWQNLLAGYPCITVDEVLDAQQYAAYEMDERDKAMLVCLKSFIEHRELQNATSLTPRSRSSPRL